jgi:hypothetical protein
VGGAAPEVNKLIIALGMRQGVILNINYLSKLIGFYFCDFDTKAFIPIHSKLGYWDPMLSYFPFNETQLQFARELYSYVKLNFPDFELFDNLFANVKAYKVIVDLHIEDEIDYFQLLLDNNMAIVG